PSSRVKTPTLPSLTDIPSVPMRVSKKQSSTARSFSTAPETWRSMCPGKRSSSPNREAHRRPPTTMRRRPSMIKTIALLAVWLAPLGAETYVLANARIVPITSPPIEHGSMVVKDGKIAAVGGQVKPPAGAKRIDATGLTVYPGMIDAYTNLGLTEIA